MFPRGLLLDWTFWLNGVSFSRKGFKNSLVNCPPVCVPQSQCLFLKTTWNWSSNVIMLPKVLSVDPLWTEDDRKLHLYSSDCSEQKWLLECYSNCFWQIMSRMIPSETAVSSEGTCKHYIVLKDMASCNTKQTANIVWYDMLTCINLCDAMGLNYLSKERILHLCKVLKYYRIQMLNYLKTEWNCFAHIR